MTTPPARDALHDALLSMQTRAEMDAFLADLCTPAELRAFAERWQVARLLDAGGKSYREIAAEAHAKVDHGDLTSVLYFQGYAADEFVTD